MIHRPLALVTGATSGIGRAFSELLSQKGFSLILSGRNVQALQEVQESLSKVTDVVCLAADLSLLEDRRKIIEMIRDTVPDLVVNNAGFGLYGEILDQSTEEISSLVEVNAKAVLELTSEAAKALVLRKKEGVILNVSSAAAFQVLPCMAVYAASKAFVNSFSQAMDFELKNKGVRVVTICPGPVATQFQARAHWSIRSKESVMSPSFVAEEMWRQIEKKKRLHIIDWKIRLMTLFSFILPKWMIAVLVKRTLMKRREP